MYAHTEYATLTWPVLYDSWILTDNYLLLDCFYCTLYITKEEWFDSFLIVQLIEYHNNWHTNDAYKYEQKTNAECD